MKILSKTIVSALALCLLLAPLGVQAQTAYTQVGKILSLSKSHINVDDSQERLSPTVKVVFPGNKLRKLSDLRVGYTVGLKMIKYQGKSYVDYIYYLPKGDLRVEEDG